jgi:uncharacterized protein (TIGR02996 family)
MNDHRPFLDAILVAPDDDAPRLIYADWLAGRGEDERAEFITIQCEFSRLPKPVQRCSFKTDYGATLPRWKTGACQCRGCQIVRREDGLWETAAMKRVADDMARRLGLTGKFAIDHGTSGGMGSRKWRWVRGFVRDIACSANDWRHYAGNSISPGGWTKERPRVEGSILESQPVESVSLTTWPMIGDEDAATAYGVTETARRLSACWPSVVKWHLPVTDRGHEIIMPATLRAFVSDLSGVPVVYQNPHRSARDVRVAEDRRTMTTNLRQPRRRPHRGTP